MKTICKLDDQVMFGKPGMSHKTPRQTARAVVINGNGLYAVMYEEKFGLYCLPGGGIENGEEMLTALRREILEETGCTCDEITELGIIEENRASLDFTSRAYYFVVHSAVIDGRPQLTQAEVETGTQLQWHTLEETTRLISTPLQDTVQRRYLQARDMAALREYQALLPQGDGM